MTRRDFEFYLAAVVAILGPVALFTTLPIKYLIITTQMILFVILMHSFFFKGISGGA